MREQKPYSRTRGLLAAAAGIRPTRATRRGETVLGDVLQALDGKPIDDFGTLTDLLDAHAVGDTVDIALNRDGEQMKVSVQLGGIAGSPSS